MAGAPAMALGDRAEATTAKGDESSKDASPTTWKRSQLLAHNIRIKVGDREELPVRSMNAKVTIDGSFARVVIDVLVNNNLRSNLEGTFQLRLPDGASPYFFAFGENILTLAENAPPPITSAEETRKMGTGPVQIIADRNRTWRAVKEARVVPKEKAAFAYRSTVARSVDPALLEWAGPSIFTARIFPLLVNKTHRIVIGYDVPLTRIGQDLQYNFDLPEKVGSKVIDIAVSTLSTAAIEIEPKVPPVKEQGKEHFRFEDPTGTTITLRQKAPPSAHLLGADESGNPFFAVDVPLDLASKETPKTEEAAVFLMDTSLSSNPDRFNIWLRLLTSILENNRDTLKRFNVAFFNIEQAYYKPDFIENTPANIEELKTFAETLTLEGATDLAAALKVAAKPPGIEKGGAPAKWNVFLLSDGSSTWGESDLFALTRSLSQSAVSGVYAYNTGLSGTDTEGLALITRELGGAVFAVTGDAEVKAAAIAHRKKPWKIIEMKLAGTQDLLILGRPKYLFQGQTIRVAGRGTPDKNAQLELLLEQAGKQNTVRIPVGEPLPSQLAARVYGQVAVSQIEELTPTSDFYAKAYSVHFRIAAKTCSLVMLESEADYERFGIKPEEESLTVKQSEVNQIVSKTLAKLAGVLGNPKEAFLTWLRTLPSMPGMSIAIPSSLNTALEKMPESSFRVEAPPLAVKQRVKSSVQSEVLTALATHKIEYDIFTADAERRKAALGTADALKTLSSLVEESPGDSVLARDVGISAMTWGLSADAYHLFRRVAGARPYEPQTYRAMAQSLARLGMVDLAIAYFEIGLAGRWDGRFGEFRKILAIDYLGLLRNIENGVAKTSVPDFARDRLLAVGNEIQIGRADIVIMITWNTDATDVDLHVIEPSGEECFYAHNVTASGGRITQDVTQGYGPEMYVLPRAPDGHYSVRAKYFASDRNRTSARTKVSAVIIEDYGSAKQRTVEKMVTLEYGKEMHDIIEINRKALQVAGP